MEPLPQRTTCHKQAMQSCSDNLAASWISKQVYLRTSASAQSLRACCRLHTSTSFLSWPWLSQIYYKSPACCALVQELALTPPLPGCAPGTVEYAALDLARMDSVRAFCGAWSRRHMPLHLLVANAGVMSPRDRTTTADGLEVQFQVCGCGCGCVQLCGKCILLEQCKHGWAEVPQPSMRRLTVIAPKQSCLVPSAGASRIFPRPPLVDWRNNCYSVHALSLCHTRRSIS